MAGLDVKGVEINVGDKISFKVKHQYDKAEHVGTFIGYLQFSAAKKLYDLAPFYRGLRMDVIDTTTPLESMNFVIIQDEDHQYFASAIDWIEEGTVKKVNVNSITVVIYDIADDEEKAAVLQQIRNSGHPVKLLS